MRSGQVINEDLDDPMPIMSSADHIYPAAQSCFPQLPLLHQHQQGGGGSSAIAVAAAAAVGAGKQQRRRRRKAKNKEGTAGLKKRKLSDEQANMLEMSFGREHNLESERKDKLAAELGLDPRQVAVWFQNRRARWKNKRLELEFSKLTSQHHSTLLDKCNLETQVLQLQAELEEAQKEIERLSAAGSCGCSNMSMNSPTSSMTMDALDHPAAAAAAAPHPIFIPADYPFNHPNLYFQGPSLDDHWNLYNIF